MKVYALEVNFSNAEKFFDRVISSAKKTSEAIAMRQAKEIMKETIVTSGFGSWKKNKMNDEPPLLFLKHFIKIDGNKVGFLSGKKVGKKFLNRYVENHQAGFSVRTNKKMQRFLAMRKYLVRRSTKRLFIPARPIVPLAEKKINIMLGSFYSKAFEKTIDYGNKKNFRNFS